MPTPLVLVDTAAIALGLVVWGAHAVAPWRLARAPVEARRPWALLAFPLLLAAVVAALAAVATQPDAAIATGLDAFRSSVPVRFVAILTAAALVGDLLLAFAWRELEPVGWRVLGGLHLAAALAVTFAAEMLRIGEGPRTMLPVTLAAIAARFAITLATGDALAPGRPLLALVSLAAVPAYLLSLPAELGLILLRSGVVVTAGAGMILLAVTRWLPPRLRAPAAIAGAVLIAIVLARAAAASALFGNRIPVPTPPPRF